MALSFVITGKLYSYQRGIITFCFGFNATVCVKKEKKIIYARTNEFVRYKKLNLNPYFRGHY